MNFLTRVSVPILLVAAPFCCNADDFPECFAEELEAHVLEQYGIYGPLSTNREYFGFIYRHEGVIASAIARGSKCWWTQTCEVNTRDAAAQIPKGAKVLGEWHTHPHSTGSQGLSPTDVRGANKNLHVHCYRAFFSKSNGEIFSWSPSATLVLTATASLVPLGDYRRQVAPAQSAEVQYGGATY
jgi:hypothetical protein